ncbi:hypothetical protein DB41_IT00080 [Neochlamydia sp. TUME1]|uniref:hypothetical protein n=1 Tax=Neochlamydia sp. TUME1 TaxID=1478174 RepID=UPI00057E796A|nr:hypothetical protein [Neochlamydia sp. TUME1]KIC74145.1 hypothetical protein DB41_IT00080 [Neochlamydia sp. TUME1]
MSSPIRPNSSSSSEFLQIKSLKRPREDEEKGKEKQLDERVTTLFVNRVKEEIEANPQFKAHLYTYLKMEEGDNDSLAIFQFAKETFSLQLRPAGPLDSNPATSRQVVLNAHKLIPSLTRTARQEDWLKFSHLQQLIEEMDGYNNGQEGIPASELSSPVKMHAETRLLLFFHLSVAFFKSESKIEPRGAKFQLHQGSEAQGTEACHHSLFPEIRDDYLEKLKYEVLEAVRKERKEGKEKENIPPTLILKLLALGMPGKALQKTLKQIIDKKVGAEEGINRLWDNFFPASRSLFNEQSKFYYLNNHTIIAPATLNRVDDIIERNVRKYAINQLENVSGGRSSTPIAATVRVGKEIEKVLGQSLLQTDEKLNKLKELEKSVRALDKHLFKNNQHLTTQISASFDEKFENLENINNLILRIPELLDSISSLNDSHSLPLVIPNLEDTKGLLASFPQDFQTLRNEYNDYAQQKEKMYAPINIKIEEFKQAIQRNREAIKKTINKQKEHEAMKGKDDYYHQLSEYIRKVQAKLNKDEKGLSAWQVKRAHLAHPGHGQMLTLLQTYSFAIKGLFGSSISSPIDPSSFTRLEESRHFIGDQLQATSQLTEKLSQEVMQRKYSSYRSYEQLQSILISQTLQVNK